MTTTPDTLAQQVAVHRAHVKHVQGYSTRLTSTSDGDFVLSGVKHYSTGALFAHWIGVLARNDHDQPQVVDVPADTPGGTVQLDVEFGRHLVHGSVPLRHGLI